MKRIRAVIFTIAFAASAASCAQDDVQPTRVTITDEQIAQIQRLIRVTQDDDPQKPDFHFLEKIKALTARFAEPPERGL